MNGKTARLLRKYSLIGKLGYTETKKKYRTIPKNERGKVKRLMEEDLHFVTGYNNCEEGE